MSHPSRIGLVSVLLSYSAAASFAQNPTLSLKAVRLNGESIAPTNSIAANPGDVIEAEIFASDWSPNGEKLRGFESVVGREAFQSGDSGTVLPLGWDRPPLIDDDICCGDFCEPPEVCPPEFPVCAFGRICIGTEYDPDQGVFINQDREDWVFWCAGSAEPCLGLPFWDTSGAVIRHAAVLLSRSDASVYTPPEKYCGSLILQVSDDADGLFSFDVLPPPESDMRDEFSNHIEPLETVGLSILVSPCGDGVADPGEECDDGAESAACDADCTSAECGDGTFNIASGEECDNGPDNSDTDPDACRTDCTLPRCGDNVADSGEDCDAADAGICSGPCSGDCTCAPVGIPTVSTWGLVILALSLLVTGRVYFGRRHVTPR